MSGRPARKPWSAPDLRHLHERTKPHASVNALSLAKALCPEDFDGPYVMLEGDFAEEVLELWKGRLGGIIRWRR